MQTILYPKEIMLRNTYSLQTYPPPPPTQSSALQATFFALHTKLRFVRRRIPLQSEALHGKPEICNGVQSKALHGMRHANLAATNRYLTFFANRRFATGEVCEATNLSTKRSFVRTEGKMRCTYKLYVRTNRRFVGTWSALQVATQRICCFIFGEMRCTYFVRATLWCKGVRYKGPCEAYKALTNRRECTALHAKRCIPYGL